MCKDIYPLISNKLESNVVINCHVFAKPRKRSYAFWWFLFIPLVLAVWDSYINWIAYYVVERFLGTSLALHFYTSQTILTLVLAFTTFKCFFGAVSLDKELVKANSKYERSVDMD
jgi:hypothetical protein